MPTCPVPDVAGRSLLLAGLLSLSSALSASAERYLAPQSIDGQPVIALGSSHACALRDTGRVFCWGDNEYGQLGDGTTTRRLTPVPVTGAWSTGATRIGAGIGYSCLLRQTGRVACWGTNSRGQLGDGTNIDR